MTPGRASSSVAVILAAGSSSRLGRPKQLLDYHGEPLVVHAARVALGARCDRTIMIWSQAATLPPIPGVEMVENPQWQEGIASSIRIAVEAAGDARILITLVDQPLVTSEHLIRLIRSSAPIAATAYRNVAGVPAAFGPEFREDLLALRGDRGARSVIEAHGAELIAFEAAAIDIDREEDYRRL
jgi:molybdenum cofactor cytidylyltransferase